jgi:hypothetical protein
MVKANNLSWILRVAKMDAVMIFPSLVLYPHEKGACNTQVRVEVKRRLTIWGAGDIEFLAALVRASKATRPFTLGTSMSLSATQRARAFILKGKFSRATMLADSFGVAPSSVETYRALTQMHPAPGVILQHDLVDLFGEPIAVVMDTSATTIPVDKVRECIAAAPPPLTSPHRVGWRMEHLETLPGDDAFATALATFISNIAIGEFPATTVNYLASATLVALLKKNEEHIHALRELLGPDFQRRVVTNQGRHCGRHRPALVCGWVQGRLQIPTLGPAGCDGGRSRVYSCDHGCHYRVQ